MALPISPATRNRVFAIAIVAFCAVCVAAPRPWHGGLRAFAVAAARPPLVLLAAAHDGLRRGIDRARSLWGAADEIERLRDENRALRQALARQVEETRRAQAQLRSLEGFQAYRATRPVRTLSVIPAHVLAADPSPWRHHLVVDRGAADGVRLGAAAVRGGAIVGTVTDLHPRAATVRLLTDSRGGLTVRIARSGDVGFLQGTGDRRTLLQLKWVTIRRPQEGDTLITAELDPRIPPGLVAGHVVEVAKAVRPIVYDARVRPVVPVGHLTDLLLVSYTPDDVEDLLGAERRDGE